MKIYTNEKYLLSALKERDKCAFEFIYKKYYNDLYHYALRYMLSKSEAYDSVQDVFVSLIEKSSSISINSNIKGYLYLTLKNICLNKLKHYNVVDIHSENIASELDFLNNLSSDDKEIMLSRMEELINNLPIQQQSVIKMKVEGKSYEEISEILNISKHTVNVHLKRAYQYIREKSLTLFLFFVYLILK